MTNERKERVSQLAQEVATLWDEEHAVYMTFPFLTLQAEASGRALQSLHAAMCQLETISEVECFENVRAR